MRTTVRLESELLERLKARARAENISLTRMVNRAIRAGLEVDAAARRPQRRYRERVQAMGTPRLSLDKALALAAALEDEEVVRELAARS
jgi:hypothetical protein